jgi:hypothetical protein
MPTSATTPPPAASPSAARTRAVPAVAAAAVTALAAAALLAAPGTAAAHPATHPHPHPAVATEGAVFAQSDNTTANTVVAYHRAADGTLTQAGVYPTGGRGGVLDGSVVDHLASQGSLTYDRAHGLLYAVNAGSDTITVFAVRGDRLARLQQIGSGGRFPVSVTAHGDQVFVLNALDGGSVQGFLRVGDRLVRMAPWHRALGLDTGTAPQFTHTPAQVSFTPDGSRLVVTTKAGGNSIEVFAVRGPEGLAARPVVTADPGAVPFGFVFDARGRLQVTEAGPNAVATFVLRPDGHAVKVGEAATGQAATCWAVRVGHTVWASNAGSGTLSAVRVGAHPALAPAGTTATHPGTTDAAASSDGRALYVQTGAAGVVDEFRVGPHGSLTPIGSVTVPGGVGGEGIAAS